jgi:hypothetical protein
MDIPDILNVIIRLLPDPRPFGRTCRGIYSVYAATDFGQFWRGSRHSRDVSAKIAPLLPYTATDYAAAGNFSAMIAVGGADGNSLLAAIANDHVEIVKCLCGAGPCGDGSVYWDECIEHAIDNDAIKCFEYLESIGVMYEPRHGVSIDRIGRRIRSRDGCAAMLPETWEAFSEYKSDPQFWDAELDTTELWCLLSLCPPDILAELYKFAGVAFIAADDAPALVVMMTNSELYIVGFFIRVRRYVNVSALADKFATAGYRKLARICRSPQE